MLDIRMPIGLMFAIIGGLLAVYGLGQAPQAYAMALGYNLNLIWGGCMALFGVVMLTLMKLEPYIRHGDSQAPKE